jgi:hypothetical protein
MLFVLGINPWQCMMIPFSELVYDQGCGKNSAHMGLCTKFIRFVYTTVRKFI